MKKNIYLVGFMGSGKTSIGKRLATAQGWDFVDMDDMIEEHAGKSIPDIFEHYGESGFREIEREILDKTFELRKTVVATGGGAPCFFDNMERINAQGISFYLRHSVAFFVDKLYNSNTRRPLIEGKSEKQLRKYVVEALCKRDPHYVQSQYTISIDGLKKSESCKLITAMLKIIKAKA